MPARDKLSSVAWKIIKHSRFIPSGCLVWRMSTNQDGYGHFGLHGKRFRAPRAAYECFVGPIPCGVYVLHKCDNPRCVNPEHLFLGTQLDNMRDAVAKGRVSRHGKSHRSRLTNEQLSLAKIAHEIHGVMASELALELGISPSSFSVYKRNGFKTKNPAIGYEEGK